MQNMITKNHPYVIAILPAIYLAAINLHEVNIIDVVVACIVMLIVVSIWYKIFQLIFKNTTIVTAAISTILILGFLFGPLQFALWQGHYSKQDALALTLCLYIPFLFIIFYYNFINKSFAEIYNVILANIGVGFFILSIVTFFSHHYFTYYASQLYTKISPTTLEAKVEQQLDNYQQITQVTDSTYKPDVYFIIFDGYLRSNVLKYLYGFDNSKFDKQLKQLGFFVATNSASNYPMTHLSLSSTLNMNYLQPEINKYGNKNFRPYYNLLRNSQVANIFKQHGYQYITFASDWNGTKYASRYSDQHISNFYSSLSDYHQVLLKMTPIQLLVERSEQKLILANLKQAEYINKTNPNPKFMFLHLRLPYPPHSFNKNGEFLPAKHINSYTVDGYIEELQYTNSLIINFLNSLIANSRIAPIILLQSDHGSYFSTWKFNEQEDKSIIKDDLIKERFSNLNASFAPKELLDQLPNDITSVNTFRYILNYLEFTNLPILENKHYFKWYTSNQPVVDVTQRYLDFNEQSQTSHN